MVSAAYSPQRSCRGFLHEAAIDRTHLSPPGPVRLQLSPPPPPPTDIIAHSRLHLPSATHTLSAHTRHHSHDQMASGVPVPHPDKPSMTVGELVAFTKKELDADAERQAKVAAAEAGDLQSQTGSTLDLSHKNIHALPVEVIALIKDRVER